MIEVCDACTVSSLSAAFALPDDPLEIHLSDDVWVEPDILVVRGTRTVSVLADEGSSASVSTLSGSAVFRVQEQGSLTLQNVSAVKVGGRVFEVTDAASLDVDGGVFSSLGLVSNGAVLAGTGGQVQLKDVRFLDSNAIGDGGLVSLVSTALTATASEFRGGFARQGGAVWIVGPRPAQFTDCRFTDNEATGAGGAIAAAAQAQISIVRSTFTGNSAQRGGAVAALPFANPQGIELVDCDLTGNDALLEGGAVLVEGNSLSITGSRLWRNRSTGDGGAVAARGALRLDTSFLCENAAADRGGAAFVAAPQTVPWLHVRFVDNEAAEGGAIDLLGADTRLPVRFSSFLGNEASKGAAVDCTGGDAQEALDSFANLFAWSSGDHAVRANPSPYQTVSERQSVYWENPEGDTVPFRSPTAKVGDPLLEVYAPGQGCEALVDRYAIDSALVDRVDVVFDPDGTAADAGAWGGFTEGGPPWWVDEDEDGYALLYDCDDQRADIHPVRGADPLVDTPYDGVDQDCDGWSDDDADHDGFDDDQHGGTDCDDTDAATHPGSVDRAGVDGDCDGDVDADADGFPEGADCDDTDPATYPGAPEDTALPDRDCDGWSDPEGVLQPVRCDGGAGASAWGGLALAALVAARRRR